MAALIALTIALGIGLATALYGYFDFWLHPRIDAPHADRIVSVRILYPDWMNARLSSEEVDAARGSHAFELLASSTATSATVTAPAGNLFEWGQIVDGGFFPLYGASAGLGRLLSPDDERPDAPPAVVLSHRLWRDGFGADRSVVGRSVELNGHPATVVGVTRRDFHGLGYSSEFFVPLHFGETLLGTAPSGNPLIRWLFLRGRLPAGPHAAERAQSRIAAAFAALSKTSPVPEGESREPVLVAESALDPDSRQDPFFVASRLLAAAGALFVLLGAANLDGLLLARATARDSEWATRKALGASPLRLAGAIVGRLLAPTCVGLLGAVGVAKLAESWINATLRTPMAGLGPGWASENSAATAISWRAWLFALAATAATLAIAALPPLLRVLRRDISRTLHEHDARSGGSAALAPRRLLVAGQLALAVTLLVGASLLVRSLESAAASRAGFEPRGLAFATLKLPRGSDGPQGDVRTVANLLTQAHEVAGIDDATVTLLTPFSSSERPIAVALAESPDAPRQLSYTIVGPGYFETLGVPLVAGRALDQRDAPGSSPAVVVTAALARKLWGGEASAVGRRIHLTQPIGRSESGPDFEVVGVAADAAYVVPTVPRPEMLFFAYGQKLHTRMTLMLRSGLPLGRLERQLRALVASARSDASLVDLVSASEQRHRTLHPLRLNATVASVLGLAGLVCALVGLFALQAYMVNLRRRDFAVRLALGARGADLARLVLREASWLALLGVVVGLAAAAAVSRLLASLLYGVGTLDPESFAIVPLILGAAVFAASLLPARRAARTDPARNLRAL